MNTDPRGRLVLLPSYNSGPLLAKTAAAALSHWPAVLAVIDGSTDQSAREIASLAAHCHGLSVLELPANSGKGAAVLAGLRRAPAFSHVLVMDADGQHPAVRIPEFMELSMRHPEAMILGVPRFAADAPAERVWGRRIGNFFARLETLGMGPRDSLFGFRLYPAARLREVMEGMKHGRGFDFDTEASVRLTWAGVRPIHREVPVFYPPRESGGVTHFHYVRHNLLLARTHLRLCLMAPARLPKLWRCRQQWKSLPA